MVRKRWAGLSRLLSAVMAATIGFSPILGVASWARAQGLPIDPSSPGVQDLLSKYMNGDSGGGATQQTSPLDRASQTGNNRTSGKIFSAERFETGPSLIEQDYRARLRSMVSLQPDRRSQDDKDADARNAQFGSPAIDGMGTPMTAGSAMGGSTVPAGQTPGMAYGAQSGMPGSKPIRPNDPAVRDIKQFGYDSFRQTQGDAQVTGRVPDAYILGVGDQLVVSFMGPKPKNITTRVDREGRLIVGDLKPIAAAGRSFADVRADLEAATKQSMLGTEVFLSLADVRQISVALMGEVNVPGVQQLSGFSTVVEALSRAGGIKKTGSLRRVVIQRGERQIPVDLYGVLTGGSGQDIQLADGDRLVVPVIGPTIAIAGEVRRPGIYELRTGQASRDEALRLAGGTIRPRGSAILLNHIDSGGQQTISRLADGQSVIQEGDILYATLTTDSQRGAVTLSGHVTAPGSRSLSGVRTLRGLIGNVENLELDPYLPFAILQTTDPRTRARVMKAVNLEQVLYSGQDQALADDDKLIVLSRKDIAFLNSEPVRRAILFPDTVLHPVVKADMPPMPDCPATTLVARIVADTQSDRFANAVRALTQKSQVENEKEDKTNQNKGLDTNGNPIAGLSQPVPSPAQMPVPRIPPELTETECPAVFRSTPEALLFTLDHVVAVSGAVMRPGAYPAAPATSVQSLAAVAGGLVNNADLSSVEVASYDVNQAAGVGQIDLRMVDITKTPPDSVTVNPGSTLRFNVVRSDQERGVVQLAGEVNRPGLYPIRRGEKLSELLARAGGLTAQAYAYGAVFTRESVKKAQEDGIRRASREMNAALAAVALKPGVSGQALGAAQKFVETLNDQQAVGRMVVEADPDVLAQRPELDTILEPGDRLTIPKRMNYVSVSGDVLNPGTLQFVPGKTARDYLKESGGFQKNADKKRLFLIYPNGTAEPVRVSSWSSGKPIMPGSTIVVPTNIKPYDTLTIVRDITGILGSLALSAASIAVINK